MKRYPRADNTPARASLAIVLLCAPPLTLQAAGLPPLHTHQSYVEDVTSRSALPISDPKTVFDFVLQSLPSRVRVYPTENYYYFHFHHRGVRYAGNIRLAARDRDDGKVHFAYYEDTPTSAARAVRHVVLDRSAGVRVERIARFLYRVSLGGRSVIFELNDLSGAAPPAGMLLSEEKFLGPIFDESGIRFFLVFNRPLGVFHYLLDETTPAPEEFVSGPTDRILTGKRTGFAVYRDHRRERKILIGVLEPNVRANNYFDGPFDQLPENFIAGDELREAMIASEPSLAGKIDRFGYLNDDDRHVIAPYALYHDVAELEEFDRCAARVAGTHNYARCFDIRLLMTDRPDPR